MRQKEWWYIVEHYYQVSGPGVNRLEWAGSESEALRSVEKLTGVPVSELTAVMRPDLRPARPPKRWRYA